MADDGSLIDGPINGESFLAYVRQVLVPTLRPGDVAIIDDLGGRKGAAVREAVEAAGARKPPTLLDAMFRSGEGHRQADA